MKFIGCDLKNFLFKLEKKNIIITFLLRSLQGDEKLVQINFQLNSNLFDRRLFALFKNSCLCETA